jgi:iron complex transport system ATP-binding protein
MSVVEAVDLALPGRLAPASLQLSAGTVTALIGPNGSGKTSLLHALAGVGGPSGTVTIDGVSRDAAAPAQRSRLLAYVPASRELTWPLTARDLIALGGAREGEIAEVARELALEEFMDRRADRLSTGERSRILIARALASRPTLLLLDEPTANLDPLWRIRLLERLRDRAASGRHTIVLAMHDLDDAARCADRLIVMQGGRIAADGPAAAVIDEPIIQNVFGVARDSGVWRAI